MRALIFTVMVALTRGASADAHREMAAALESQADVYPGPAALPTQAANRAREATSAPRPGDPHAAAGRANGQAQAQTPAQALVHQAQAASAVAAGHAQAQAAKQRAAAHPHGTPHVTP